MSERLRGLVRRAKQEAPENALTLVLDTVVASAQVHDHSAFPLPERTAREALARTIEGEEANGV